MREYYYYLRDKKSKPIVTVCLLVDGDKVARGLAVCSLRDQPEKRKGRAIALARATYAMTELRGRSERASAGDLAILRQEAIRALDDTIAMTTSWIVLSYKAWFSPHLTDFEKNLIAEQPTEKLSALSTDAMEDELLRHAQYS